MEVRPQALSGDVSGHTRSILAAYRRIKPPRSLKYMVKRISPLFPNDNDRGTIRRGANPHLFVSCITSVVPERATPYGRLGISNHAQQHCSGSEKMKLLILIISMLAIMANALFFYSQPLNLIFFGLVLIAGMGRSPFKR